MVQGIGVAKLGETGKIQVDRVIDVNILYESPAERYMKIQNILNEHSISTWDIICFSSIALAWLGKHFEWLLPEGVEAIKRNVWFAHYYDPDTNCGIESRRRNPIPSGENIPDKGGRSNPSTESTEGSSIPNGESSTP